MDASSNNRPRKVFLELTRACNLACTHCLNDSGTQMEAELQDDEVLALVSRLAAFGICEIRFTGGEPTMRPVLEKAIALAARLKIQPVIGSNAVAITEALSERLFQAGLRSAIISVDGDETHHDAIRGRGSFQRTWRGIRALRDHGIAVRVNAVAMKSTFNGFRSLCNRCAEERVRLFIRRYIPSGRARGNASEFLTKGDYERLREDLTSFIEMGIVDGHYLTPNSHEHCSAGKSAFVILPNGDVKSCGFLSELGENSYGNVRREELAVIWQRVTSSQFLRHGHSSLTPWLEQQSDMPKTNCLAVAIGGEEALIQLRRKST